MAGVFNYKLLKMQMKKQRITRQMLAKKLTEKGEPMRASSVNAWFANEERDRRTPSLEKIKIIAEVIGCSMGDLIDGVSYANMTRLPAENQKNFLIVPVLKMTEGDIGENEFDGSFAVNGDMWLPAEMVYTINPAHARILRVLSHAMSPILEPGDLVLLDMVDGRKYRQQSGMYFIRLGGFVCLRNVEYSINGDILIKALDNNITPIVLKSDSDKSFFEVLGAVVGHLNIRITKSIIEK